MSRTATDSVETVRQRLRAFLAERTGDAGLTVSGLRRSGTGSSRENWPFDARWVDNGTAVHRRLLLRRDPPSSVVDTGRATEFALLKALAATPVPAPVAHWLDDRGDDLLRPSMIVDRHPGRADRAVLRPDKNPLGLTRAQQTELARNLCDLLASVHAVDLTATGLRNVLPTPQPDPATAELDRWERTLAENEQEPQPALRWALRWLRDHVPPPPEREVLVHGDFRPANVLVESGRVQVLLDWELAHLGDPLDDLGWYCAPVYEREHFLPGWSREDFLRRYTELTGLQIDPEALLFWQVLAMFRLAVIALQAVRVFCSGTSDRPAAPATGLARLLVATVSDRSGKASCARHRPS
ncbi:phosphotransferase family protein [Thermocrispum sp.]|uniref:phosphotransferase family protein n=1 Tax=Thermocrispum sp. TaxID=2060768 RepID=UPI00257EB14D|nr:phosphotransferase family protein [Thermocrispum sp.]